MQDRSTDAVGVAASDHPVLGEDQELAPRQSQLVAKDLRVVFADQRCSPRNPPWRAGKYRGFAGIDKATAEFRMLDRFPAAAIVQVEDIATLEQDGVI